MKMDRRGVTALPIKLLIITILVTISIPMISDVMESTEDTMNTRSMEEIGRSWRTNRTRSRTP